MPSHCPTCGADLGGRSICSHCGTLVGAEAAIARFKTQATAAVYTRLPKFGRLEPRHFLWACALMPIVLLPPLASLAAALSALRRQPPNNNSAIAFEWIAIVSAINILLSLLILYKFHFSPIQLFDFLLSTLNDFVPSIFRVFPSFHHGPKLIPV